MLQVASVYPSEMFIKKQELEEPAKLNSKTLVHRDLTFYKDDDYLGLLY